MSTEIDMLVIKLQKELKVTSVVITHDMKSAFRIADRVGLHYEGKLWEVSTPEEFQLSKNPFVQKFIRFVVFYVALHGARRLGVEP